MTETTPDGTVTTSSWNARGLPETVQSGTLPVVSETAYNARGQRTSARLGLDGAQQGAVVGQQWDPATFRLRRVTARRGSAGAWLQDLRYWYDAVGNPTRVDDAAQDEEFFANALVGPGQDFTHDALYRLIAATGREKSGMGWEPTGPAAAVGVPNAMGLWRYEQEYGYDESGNLVEIVHRRGDPVVPGWTRTMVAATGSNRLVSGQLGSDPPTSYAYTPRGAMTTIETIAGGVQYDFRDQIRHVGTNLAGGAAHYLYDGSGRRVRKVVEKVGTVEVRSYVGGYEEWERRVVGTEVDRDGELRDRRTTVHVMDGERRVRMVEVKTHAEGEAVSSATPIARLVLGNLVGSAMLEVNEAGEIISYEEYHPYGTTVYWLESGDVDVSPRRYRYTGQERDEETGLQYHWHRYYAPWLGRWTSVDPAGLVDGGNRYGYVGGRVVGSLDGTGLGTDEAQHAKTDQLDRRAALGRAAQADSQAIPPPEPVGDQLYLGTAVVRPGASQAAAMGDLLVARYGFTTSTARMLALGMGMSTDAVEDEQGLALLVSPKRHAELEEYATADKRAALLGAIALTAGSTGVAGLARMGILARLGVAAGGRVLATASAVLFLGSLPALPDTVRELKGLTDGSFSADDAILLGTAVGGAIGGRALRYLPTPGVPPRRRLKQDVGVAPAPPIAKPSGAIGKSPAQKDALATALAGLKELGAKDIRVNQHQVNFEGAMVGINKPDLQFSLFGLRFYYEWDRVGSKRGVPHEVRIVANDPTGIVLLITKG